MREAIRGTVLSLGADMCGFASVGRFGEAPPGFGPRDILPGCRTVIAFGVALPRGLAKVEPRLIYGHYNNLTCPQVDAIALRASKRIEMVFGGIAVPLPCDNPYEYWDEERLEGRGLLSMKHAAVQAGLGWMGRSTLLLSRRYGNMVTLGAILTSLALPSDELCEGGCIEGCQRCIDACPVGAIGDGTVDQALCRGKAYGRTARGFDTVDCNACRTACPLNNVGREGEERT